MSHDTITHDGMTFKIEKEHDHDAGTPWEREDGHGPVSNWTTRDKLPGELVLNTDGRSRCRYYDFAEACRIAQRDGWGARGTGKSEVSARAIAARAAREDFQHLRAWCNDEWSYIGVIVTLLDIEGNETDAVQSLWGIADDGSFAEQVAQELAEQCADEAADSIAEGAYSSGARTWRVTA